MKIFISWSGEKSKQAGLALRDWLPDVMQFAKPWMSDVDIPKGAHWPKTLGDELSQSDAGIICVTRENQEASWLLFESGALARNFKEQARVCVFLVDIKALDLRPGPLTLYQAASVEQEEAWKLVLSLNDIAGDERLEKERLQRAFLRSWPDMNTTLQGLQETQVESLERSEREILEEILSGVRSIQRDLIVSPERPTNAPYQAPRSTEEEILARIWTDVLQVARPGVHDNFFALGGHSLIVARLASRIRKEFGLEVPLKAFFENETIEGQAALIRRLSGGGDSGGV